MQVDSNLEIIERKLITNKIRTKTNKIYVQRQERENGLDKFHFPFFGLDKKKTLYILLIIQL